MMAGRDSAGRNGPMSAAGGVGSLGILCRSRWPQSYRKMTHCRCGGTKKANTAKHGSSQLFLSLESIAVLLSADACSI